MIYAEDSFFTLGDVQRVGLGVLSLMLSVLCATLVWWAAEGLKRVWRVSLAVFVLWVFVWVSPQIYYFYYMLIIDGLPLQNVVKPPPTPGKLGQLLVFLDEATLSAHSQGVLGWVLIGTALLRRRV